jgi:hypothetical protein
MVSPPCPDLLFDWLAIRAPTILFPCLDRPTLYSQDGATANKRRASKYLNRDNNLKSHSLTSALFFLSPFQALQRTTLSYSATLFHKVAHSLPPSVPSEQDS